MQTYYYSGIYGPQPGDEPLRSTGLSPLRTQNTSKYGLSKVDFLKMVVAQGGKCGICGDEIYNLCVDHCHVSGKVRALICSNCNSGLGFFKDDPVRCVAAASYLKAHK